MNKYYYIIGIDEAGRGPLAGPVAVAGVKVNVKRLKRPSHLIRPSRQILGQALGKAKSAKRLKNIFKNIRDSKKLSAKKRAEWFEFLTNHQQIEWAVTQVWPKVIDEINIAEAANLGARRVYKKLAGDVPCAAVLDGSLYLSKKVPHRTIIKGDEKVPVISAASIIAKVTRDRTMLRLHKKYPQYGFDIHKGYGTRLHRSLVKKFGRSKVHRKSFKVAK